MSVKVLLAEDETRMRQVISMLLSDLDLRFIEADNGGTALELFEQDTFGLVITDLKLPRLNGMGLLKAIKQADPEIPVIVITAFGSIENAVEAIRQGAFDYVTKPFKEERLRSCVKKALRISQLTSEVRNLRKEIESQYNFGNMIGTSPEICRVLELAGDVANRDTTVLVTGESGTGKELLSKAIHFNSPRAGGPFLPVNCAAIPSTLLESELFGYEEGAFTDAKRLQKGKFEQASGGTLFLDEIGDMSLEVQARLLRVLESRRFQRLGGTKTIDADVRIIAATNKNLKKRVKARQFRDDLFYRINVFPIHIPPLRQHRKDIPLLSNHFIRKFSTEFGRKAPVLTETALSLLEENRWRGNIRELKNVIERAMILCKGERITARHLLLHEMEGTGSGPPARSAPDMEAAITRLMGQRGVDIQQLEHRLLTRAMQMANQNVTKAARLLGLSRPTLRYRLEKYGIKAGAGEKLPAASGSS